MAIHHTGSVRCPHCRSETLSGHTYTRTFSPPTGEVIVELLSSRCSACGAEITLAAQHAENLKRLQERKSRYGEYLLGEEILQLRRLYGMTQTQASTIFGKGKIAFSRYENEASYPDITTTRLLRLAIEKPDVVESLARGAGVTLPLWESRCAEVRSVRVTMLRSQPEDTRWLQAARSTPDRRPMFRPKGTEQQTLSLAAVNDSAYQIVSIASA